MFIGGFDVYKMYVGLVNHFYTVKYDYWKFNKKIKQTIENFKKRNDKDFFHVLSNFFKEKIDFENYFIGTLKYKKLHIAEFIQDKNNCMDRYTEHTVIVNALLNKIPKDIEIINEKRKQNIGLVSDGSLFKIYSRDEITLESFCFFDFFFGLFDYYDKFFTSIEYDSKKIFLKKYSSYLKNTISKDVINKLFIMYRKNFL